MNASNGQFTALTKLAPFFVTQLILEVNLRLTHLLTNTN